MTQTGTSVDASTAVPVRSRSRVYKCALEIRVTELPPNIKSGQSVVEGLCHEQMPVQL
jgi:hypothetical protein